MTKIKKFYIESELVFKEKPKVWNFQDLKGQKFGRLVVLGYAGSNSQSQWFCKCDCRNITKVIAANLKRRLTISCGCFGEERKTTHGHDKADYRSRTYITWDSMIQRCTNPNTPKFKDYGGRGITVCKRWLKFENFFKDMGDRPAGKTLDRKENDKGYFKENCRWATQREQMNNTRRTRFLTFNGKTQNVTQWAAEIGVNRGMIFKRLKRGWTVEMALSTII